MLVTGNLSLEALDLVRKEEQVHNFEDSMRFTYLDKNFYGNSRINYSLDFILAL